MKNSEFNALVTRHFSFLVTEYGYITNENFLKNNPAALISYKSTALEVRIAIHASKKEYKVILNPLEFESELELGRILEIISGDKFFLNQKILGFVSRLPELQGDEIAYCNHFLKICAEELSKYCIQGLKGNPRFWVDLLKKNLRLELKRKKYSFEEFPKVLKFLIRNDPHFSLEKFITENWLNEQIPALRRW